MAELSMLSRFLRGLRYARSQTVKKDVFGELCHTEATIPQVELPPDFPRTPPPLPQELVDRIVDLLHGDLQTLVACTLVSRTWSYRSSGHVLRELHVGSLRLQLFVSDLKSTRSRLALHIRRLCIRYQQPSIEHEHATIHTLLEACTMDVSTLLLAIRGLAPQLERFSLFDGLGNTRCLRIREDSSRLISGYALAFHGDVEFTGISTESIVAFVLECSYVRTLSIDSTCVPPYLVLPARTGSRHLHVGTLKIQGDMSILRYMAPLLAQPSHLGEIDATFNLLGGCTDTSLCHLNAFVDTTGHELQMIRLRWAKETSPPLREMSKHVLAAFKSAEMLQRIEVSMTRQEDWIFLVTFVLGNAPQSLRRVQIDLRSDYLISFQRSMTQNSWQSAFDAVGTLPSFECFQCRAAWAEFPVETKTATLSTVPPKYRTMIAFTDVL
ncbi:hypothetical protein PsYK624_152170 [Phanerochaete sordida]|uniref:F-box domain-containing protein n=1 Tax=Phanerochaete sordida TaxID=48140 RepID=A0A9P3LLR6_9APHY|nr:hypothetical protein PsYK624_152170 [Phanerochaete sordida]